MIMYFYINFVFIKHFIILIISNIVIRFRLLRRAFFVLFAPQTISTICALIAPFASDYLVQYSVVDIGENIMYSTYALSCSFLRHILRLCQSNHHDQPKLPKIKNWVLYFDKNGLDNVKLNAYRNDIWLFWLIHFARLKRQIWNWLKSYWYQIKLKYSQVGLIWWITHVNILALVTSSILRGEMNESERILLILE
jgi:hypothetical protein